MKFLIFLPTLFTFLFTLFKLVKDDHVFLRRNVKIEHFFDIAFISIAVGLLISGVFSARNTFSISLFGIGAFLSVLALGKYRKLPLGRLLDFFILSFMSSLPVGYLIASIYARKALFIYTIINFLVYLILTIIFKKWVFSKVMNRTMKEGQISFMFLIFYSLFSLAGNMFFASYNHTTFF